MSVPDRILTLRGYALLKIALQGKPSPAYVRLLELIAVLASELKDEGISIPQNNTDAIVN